MIIILVIGVRPKNYSIKYQKSRINIVEAFDKHKETYNLTFKYKKKTYEQVISHKYIHKKKLVDNVLKYENDDEICIFLKSKYLDTYPMCYKNDTPITMHNTSFSLEDMDFKYKKVNYLQLKSRNISVFALLDRNIAIWNHKGFTLFMKDKYKKVNILDNDVYSDNYSFKVDKYILIPDYNQKYKFDNFKRINMTNGKVSTITLQNDINFEYYYMGEKDKKGYILDIKDEREYELIPKKKNVKDITIDGKNGKIWKNKWEEVSIKKLINSKFKFEDENYIDYYITNNNLYLKYYKCKNEILVDEKIDRIVYKNKDEVYYIVGNTLYCYVPTYGKVKIATYNEFEFNEGVSIYIY